MPVVGSTARSTAVEAALVGVYGAVGEEQLDVGLLPRGREAAVLEHPLRDPQVLGLADPRAEEDRVHLGDGREKRALATPHQVARLDLGRPHQPVDRRRDVRVAEVERGLVHSRLRRVHLGACRVLGGQRVVQLLPADRLLLDQGPVARDVVVGLLEARLSRGQVRLCVGEGRLEGQGVDLVEERALAHEGTFGEGHAVQVALDAGPDLDVLEAPRLADQLHVDRHVPLDHVGHVDLRRRQDLGTRLRAAEEAERREGAEGAGHKLSGWGATGKSVTHNASLGEFAGRWHQSKVARPPSALCAKWPTCGSTCARNPPALPASRKCGAFWVMFRAAI